jgi:hypothetical protein
VDFSRSSPDCSGGSGRSTVFISAASCQLSDYIHRRLMKHFESWCRYGMHLAKSTLLQREEELQPKVAHLIFISHPFLKLLSGVFNTSSLAS